MTKYHMNKYQKYIYNFILDNCDSVEYVGKEYTNGNL